MNAPPGPAALGLVPAKPPSPDLVPGHHLDFTQDQPLRLDCGVDLAPFRLAYTTYGTLNADRSNAILICHALTGDQYFAEPHPITGKPGWWDLMVGPCKLLDPEHYFMICCNVLGGCMGTTAPPDVNPPTRNPSGLPFPFTPIPALVPAPFPT